MYLAVAATAGVVGVAMARVVCSADRARIGLMADIGYASAGMQGQADARVEISADVQRQP